MKSYHRIFTRLTFIEELLGTAPGNPQLYADFIVSKTSDQDKRDEELKSMPPEVLSEKGMTFFSREYTIPELGGNPSFADGGESVLKAFPNVPKDFKFPPRESGKPHLWDYQIKGFLKDSLGMLRQVPGQVSFGQTAYKKLVDGLIFVTPRKIFLQTPPGTGVSECQRPLRTSGPTGERTALANSETAPIGTVIDVNFTVFSHIHVPILRELLEYGMLRGIGAWRNSGKGRFTCEDVTPEDIKAENEALTELQKKLAKKKKSKAGDEEAEPVA